MTPERILQLARKHLSDKEFDAITHKHGPYDITRLNHGPEAFAQAILKERDEERDSLINMQDIAIEQKDAEIAELTEKYEQLQSRCFDGHGIQSVFDRVADLKAEIAQLREQLKNSEISIALYKSDAERIWGLMPELRGTEAAYEVHEAVHEKIKQLREALAVYEAGYTLDIPDYRPEAMGCGLEDRCITDRYEAMRYGWDEAIERTVERNDGVFRPSTEHLDAIKQEVRDKALEDIAQFIEKECDAWEVAGEIRSMKGVKDVQG